MTKRIEPKSKLAKAVKNLEVVADQLKVVAETLQKDIPATYPTPSIVELAKEEL